MPSVWNITSGVVMLEDRGGQGEVARAMVRATATAGSNKYHL